MSRVTLSYLLVVLIWGSTWYAIKFQLSVSPFNSVFYRFLLAALFSFLLTSWWRQSLRFTRKQHAWLALQGTCMFSLNYILFYFAEKYIASGLVAATFTLVIYFNMIGMRVFYGQPFSLQVFLGSLLGGSGILLLFLDSIQNFRSDPLALWGLGLGIVATVLASVANLISVRNHREKIPILAGNSWGLLYGSLSTLVLILITGQGFQTDFSFSFLISLGYLALFGTVIAFAAYLTLIAKIGPDKAAYTNILTPVIALILSGLFENFQWHWWTYLGVFFCGFGNYLALHWKSKKPITPQ